eukprot:365636-Chlamydomonas_euryale.AAC.1
MYVDHVHLEDRILEDAHVIEEFYLLEHVYAHVQIYLETYLEHNDTYVATRCLNTVGQCVATLASVLLQADARDNPASIHTDSIAIGIDCKLSANAGSFIRC